MSEFNPRKVPENHDQAIGLNGSVKNETLPCSLVAHELAEEASICSARKEASEK